MDVKRQIENIYYGGVKILKSIESIKPRKKSCGLASKRSKNNFKIHKILPMV